MDIETLFSKANELFLKNDYVHALQLYKEIIEQDAKHFQSLRKMARIEVLQNNLEQATVYYEQSLQIDIKSLNVWNDLGNVYYDLKNYESAKKAYRQTIDLDATHYWSRFNMALIYKIACSSRKSSGKKTAPTRAGSGLAGKNLKN